MKIVIIGGGVVGFTIASQLTNEGHDITVVDRSQIVADQISDSLDCMALAGNGAALEVMRSADVPNCDLLIACTAQDELNMLCCIFAKKLGCRSTIARVRTPEYADQMYFFKEELGMSMTINPELNAAREMFKLLEIPGVLKRDTFAKGRVEIIEVVPKEGDALDGTQLKLTLNQEGSAVVTVMAKNADGEQSVLSFTVTVEPPQNPTAITEVEQGMAVSVIGKTIVVSNVDGASVAIYDCFSLPVL